jgi:shikimate kinase
VSGSVVLVGFMGAGKTQVGRLVARRLDVPFVDTDKVIVERHGTIAALFAERGETGFREIEKVVVLNELAAAERGARVVALGGGAVTTDDVPPHTLFARAQSGARPLARDEALFEALYARRRPLYDEVSTAVVRTAGRERLAWVVDKVVAAVAA